jgi:hypothetical protein
MAINRAGASVLVVAVLLASCASPYVNLPARPETDDTHPAVLGGAIANARAVENQYRAKVIELGESERSVSNSLIGIGTLIAGMGLAKTHSSAVAGTALVAGSVYTFGTFNTDKRRAQVYIAGMKALECAIGAVTPLVLSLAQEQQLIDDRVSLQRASPILSAAIGNAETWTARARLADAAKFKDTMDAVNAALPAAQAAINQADESADLAGQRLAKPYQMGKDLPVAVIAIDRAVLEEIRSTENSLQAVPGILANLQGNAALFAQPAPVQATTSATAGETTAPRNGRVGKGAVPATLDVAARDQMIVDGLSDALGQLRAETIALRSRANRLGRSATLNAGAGEALKACQIEGVVKPITASPMTLNFTAKVPLIQSILVDGGNGNFTAGFLQTPATGLSPVIRPRSKGVIDVVATDQTVAGQTYQLVIEDTTQRSRQIVAVVVGATAAGSPPPGDTQSLASNQKKAIDAVVAAKELKLSGARGVTITSVVARGKGIEVSYTVAAGATVTDDEVAAAAHDVDGVADWLRAGPDLVTAVRDKAKPQNGRVAKPKALPEVVPAGLSPNEIRKIQLHLCMAPNATSGRWDAASQKALKADRERRTGIDPKRPGLADSLGDTEAKQLRDLDDSVAAARCKAMRQ